MPQAYVLQIRNYRRHSAAFSEVELGFCAYRGNCNDTPVYELFLLSWLTLFPTPVS